MPRHISGQVALDIHSVIVHTDGMETTTQERNMTATCTIGPDAVTGKRCGKPAVTTFTSSDGEHFAECAEHNCSNIIAAARHKTTGYEVDDTATVTRHGRTYIGRVVRVTRTGRAYVRITYSNGVKRIVEAD